MRAKSYHGAKKVIRSIWAEIDKAARQEPLKCYLIFGLFVISTTILSLILSNIFQVVISTERASLLLRTLASIQLITLSIVFSLAILGVQNAGRKLPGAVSSQFFKLPLFRLTFFSLVAAAVLELLTFALLHNFTQFQEIFLAFVLSVGFLTLLLLLYSVEVFRSLLSVQGLIEQSYTLIGDQESINQTVRIICDSIRRGEIQTAEQAILALQSFTKSKAIEGAKTPVTGSPAAGKILESEMHGLVESTIENDVDRLHEPLKAVISSAIISDVKYNSTSALRSTMKTMVRIKGVFTRHSNTSRSWSFYFEVYVEAAERLTECDLEEVDLKTIAQFSAIPLDFLNHHCSHGLREGEFLRVSYTLLGLYRCLYRILSTKAEDSELPVSMSSSHSRIDVVRGDESQKPPLEEIQQNLVMVVEWLYNETLEFDSSDEVPVPLAGALAGICVWVYENWGVESGLRLTGLYLESAYIFSEVDQLSPPNWDVWFNDISNTVARSDDVELKLSKEMLERYESNEYEMQYFIISDINEQAAPSQTFRDWLAGFLS